MSFDEITAIIKAKTNEEHNIWEHQRLDWVFMYKAQGATINNVKEVHTFEWEKEIKKVKSLSKSQVKRRENQAKKWLKIQ